ncbi:Glycerophosphodiester phosphodiesterase 1 [Nymphon striatum]|nr:Glycerophosphodiester phosphodiesterase 1 [Nymphon striatum]
MLEKVSLSILIAAGQFVTVIMAFVSLYFHTTYTLFFILIGVSLAIFIQYTKLPRIDSAVSWPVILAEWKTNGTRAPVIGHAGASYDAPSNTLAAFREAHKNGADGVEFDLHITKDNIGVLIHDESVDRTTDGIGLVSELTFEEIRKLDASVKSIYFERFKGEKVPTLEETIQECLKLDLAMYIDIKSTDARTIALVLEMFKKYKLYKKAVVKAFSPMLLYQLRSADPEIITVQLMRPYLTSYNDILHDAKPKINSRIKLFFAIIYDIILEWSINSWTCYYTGVSAVSLHHNYLSRFIADHWLSTGFQVMTWTVNDPIEKKYWLKNNIPIVTDSIK